MDEHTESLARDGVAGIRLLSAARLREELVELLEERQTDAPSAARLARLGDPAAAAGERGDRGALRAAARARCAATGSTSRTGGSGSRALGRLGCPREVVRALLERLQPRAKRDARHIAAAVEDGPRLVEQLRDGGLTAVGDRGARRARPPRRAAARARARGPAGAARVLRPPAARAARTSGAPTSPSSGWASRREWGRSSGELRRRKLNGELDGRRVGARRGAGADRGSVILRWDAPGPYAVVFTTRQGGVSEGPFESLNLGKARRATTPERVDENRRRVCAEVGRGLGAPDAQPPAAFGDRSSRGARKPRCPGRRAVERRARPADARASRPTA